MVKMMFFGFRRDGLSREQALAELGGAHHLSFVKKVPGLRRRVRNYPVAEVPDAAPDWVGELWFDDQGALDAAVGSQEWADMGGDGNRFANVEKTYGCVVDEQVGIG